MSLPHGRRLWLLTAVTAVAALALASVVQRDLILFNHSPSIPAGLYIRTDRAVAPGAIVTVRARDVARGEAERRGFADDRDRFIKRVAAGAGQRVCGDGEHLSVDGVVVARRHEQARMPLAWNGCRVLADDEVLLLGESPDSFDGRYWGVATVDLIEGVWRKL
jgi:type IV secretory pathway protease TraF